MLADRTAASAGLPPPRACKQRSWDLHLATDPRAGIIALDDDPRHGGDETKEALETLHGPLPHTPTVLTGSSGEHLYFRYPDGIVIRNSAGKVGPGLDVRAAGGYVIGPPSVHASGRAYEWAADAHLADVPLAPMPDWLIALATATPTGNGTGEFVVDAERFHESARNHELARLAGYLRRPGLSAKAINAALQIENERLCDRPLEAGEVRQITHGIARRYPPSFVRTTSPSTTTVSIARRTA